VVNDFGIRAGREATKRRSRRRAGVGFRAMDEQCQVRAGAVRATRAPFWSGPVAGCVGCFVWEGRGVSFHDMRWLLCLIVFVPQVACAQAAATQPAAGPVRYSHEVREGPPRLHLHVVTVDLTDPAVSIVVRPGNADPDGAGPWQTTLRTVRSTAERERMVAAVNGDFFIPKDARQIMGRRVPYFDGNWAKTVGFATSDGKAWARPTQAGWAALAVSPGNRVTIGVDPMPVPRDATEVVGGSAVVVANGRAVPAVDAPAPRTAAGVDRAGTKLVLLVVDG
jgi:hypothetical protein